MKKLATLYGGKSPIGVLALCNHGGLEVLDIEGGEYVVACLNNGENRIKYGRHKVEYSLSGRPFFRKLGIRYYMDTIMRM